MEVHMTYRSKGDEVTAAIEQARSEVRAATLAYSKGDGVDRLNAANRKLADAHDAWCPHYGMRIPTNT
jgi:hypothetical protein